MTISESQAHYARELVSRGRIGQQGLNALEESAALLRELRGAAYKALDLTGRGLLDRSAFSVIDTRNVVCVATPRLLELNMTSALMQAGCEILCFRSGSPDVVFEKTEVRGGVELKWLDRNVSVTDIHRLIQGVNAAGPIEVLVVVSRTPLSREAYRLLKQWGEVAGVETDVTFLEKERLVSWNEDEWN